PNPQSPISNLQSLTPNPQSPIPNYQLPIPNPQSPILPILAPTLIMTGLAMLLLLVQRDLGTASIFLFIYASMIYLGTGKRRVVIASLVSLGAVGAAGYALFDVVRLRVDAWLNPWADPSGRSYQIVQSLIAVAAGEIFGRGPGIGNPGLVPVAHSDFIFTAITEESGLLGVIGLLGLVGLLINRGLRIALHAPDSYRRYLAAGLTAHLGAQTILIVGGNLRLLPLTGVTLPFVSYGGSSLLTSFVSLLLLTLISSEPAESPTAQLVDPTPTLALGNALLIGLGAAALMAGWWGVIRSPNLLARTDNPRLSIADRFVERGNFFDRRGEPLTENQGMTGELARFYPYPSLSPIIGYTHPLFGQAGLEASLDVYLRGLKGAAFTLWQNQFLYGQHPPGLDVRLSLDLELQLLASEILGETTGAIVLLNAKSGEILALVSYPAYDPDDLNRSSTLDTTLESLLADPDAPLLNRATQGAYSPGTTLTPLLLAAIFAERGTLTFQLDEITLECVQPPAQPTLGAAIQAGCSAPEAALGEQLGSENILRLFQASGLYTAPEIRLPVSSSTAPIENPTLAAIETEGYKRQVVRPVPVVSPLQLALAAATLSNDGIRPAPRLSLAFHSPEEGWIPLPLVSDGSVEVFPAEAARETANRLAAEDSPTWETVSLIGGGDESPAQALTWYLGGTLPDWGGTPVVVVVLLEEGNVELAVEVGRGVLGAVVGGR
ncbi:MAG: FtsW/RodA/SpoVE family cell cycle protein, partial [Anaerolineales bacterium]